MNMSYCKKEGKDKIMFMGPEDTNKPSSAIIEDNNEEEEPGAILPNGDINWNCPCIGGLVAGPCGFEMREAIGCNYYMSKDDPRGVECEQKYKAAWECMKEHSELYDTKHRKGKTDERTEDIGVIDDEQKSVTDDLSKSTEEGKS